MWCCSRAAQPVQVMKKRRPTLSAGAMFAMTQAQIRWVSHLAKAFRLWRFRETSPKVSDSQISAIDRLLLVGKRLAARRIIAAVARPRKVRMGTNAVGKVVGKLLVEIGLKPSFQGLKDHSRRSRFRGKEAKSAFRVLARVVRMREKGGLDKAMKKWGQVGILYWKAKTDQCKKLQTLIKTAAARIAFAGISEAFERFSAGKTVYRVLYQHHFTVEKTLMRKWNNTARRIRNVLLTAKVRKMGNLMTTFRRQVKQSKSHCFDRWKINALAAKRKTVTVLNLQKPVITGVEKVSSIRKCEKITCFPVSKLCYEPLVLADINNSPENNDAERRKLTTALTTLFRNKTDLMDFTMRKWKKNALLTRKSTDYHKTITKLLAKTVKKSFFRLYFGILRTNTKVSKIEKCFKDMTSHYRLIVARRYLQWANATSYRKKWAKATAARFHSEFLSIANRHKTQSFRSIFAREKQEKTRIRFLSLLTTKRLQSAFYQWKLQQNDCEAEEMWSLARIKGVRRFLIAYHNRFRSSCLRRFQAQVKVKTRMIAYLKRVMRSDNLRVESDAVRVWRKRAKVLTQKRDALCLIRKIAERRTRTVLFLITEQDESPFIYLPQRRHKSWLQEMLQIEVGALGNYFQ